MRLAKLGKPNGCLGTKRTEESKKKMREARLAYYKRIGGMPQKTKNLLREIAKEKGSGLWMKGRQLSYMRDENHPSWKGTNASIQSIHVWVRRRKPKPAFCEECTVKPPRDLANISQEYKRDVNDFEWLCRKCHMDKDGRAKEASERMKNLNKK